MRLGKRVGDQPRKLLVYLTSESSAASLLFASRNMQRIESTKNFYINPDLSRAEVQLAFERQKRRAARKAIKRSDGSATGNNVTDDGSVTGPAAGYTDDAAVCSNLSATSAEFHPSSSSNFGTTSGLPSSSAVTNYLDSSSKTLFHS